MVERFWKIWCFHSSLKAFGTLTLHGGLSRDDDSCEVYVFYISSLKDSTVVLIEHLRNFMVYRWSHRLFGGRGMVVLSSCFFASIWLDPNI